MVMIRVLKDSSKSFSSIPHRKNQYRENCHSMQSVNKSFHRGENHPPPFKPIDPDRSLNTASSLQFVSPQIKFKANSTVLIRSRSSRRLCLFIQDGAAARLKKESGWKMKKFSVSGRKIFKSSLIGFLQTAKGRIFVGGGTFTCGKPETNGIHLFICARKGFRFSERIKMYVKLLLLEILTKQKKSETSDAFFTHLSKATRKTNKLWSLLGSERARAILLPSAVFQEGESETNLFLTQHDQGREDKNNKT